MVQGCGDARPAGAEIEEVAVVTGPAAGRVVSGAGGARGGGGANDTGNSSLAGGLLCWAATALPFLREEALHAMLIAVEQGLSPAQPKTDGPAEGRKKTKVMYCAYVTSANIDLLSV